MLIAFQRLNILRLYLEAKKGKTAFRRLHVKYYLQDIMRDGYGAYETLFLFFAN